jgi:two-component system OmpR family response regulator
MNAMPHILVVGDDEDNLTLLTKFFQKHAHPVTIAANGAAMFEALEAKRIDLVIVSAGVKIPH